MRTCALTNFILVDEIEIDEFFDLEKYAEKNFYALDFTALAKPIF